MPFRFPCISNTRNSLTMNIQVTTYLRVFKYKTLMAFVFTFLISIIGCKKSGNEQTPIDTGVVISYKTDIKPIMANHCYSCHSANASDPESPGYAMLDNFIELKDYALKPSTVNPSYTKLQARLRFIEVPGMPFKKAPLNDSLIKKIDSWVKAGAPNN
ncbi:MAG: hypothetical protein JWN56_2398 [Sphingobacteriales bacterium]|nr:hypothetical protein [Sphingobacteriales bacterium]